MSRTAASPETLAFARQLVKHEAAAASGSPSDGPPELRVAEKLRQPLSRLAGVDGFRALLMRALTIAKTQEPGLVSVQIDPDCSLRGFGAPGNRTQDAQAAVILIAELLGLLTAFVGEAIMLRLVLDVWPGFLPPTGNTGRKSNHDGPE